MTQNIVTSARGLIVRYLGPTNYKGARVKITDARGIIERPMTISFDYAEQGAIRTALAFLREQGWDTGGARVVSTQPEPRGDSIIVLREWTSRDHWRAEGNK